jgi:hypothetical protein
MKNEVLGLETPWVLASVMSANQGVDFLPGRAAIPAERAARLNFRQKLEFCLNILSSCRRATAWRVPPPQLAQNGACWGAPAVWLTLMPPIPLGTTTMPPARVSSSQPAGTPHFHPATRQKPRVVGDPGAVVQFRCGLSIRAPLVGGGSVDARCPDPDEMPDNEPGAIRRNWR